MEIFVDGGLFELAVATALGYTINFIFLRKYLLIIFSVLSILSPVVIFFYRSGELFYWLASICVLNAILLVLLLWRERIKDPKKPLFDLKQFRKIFLKKKKQILP